MQKLTVFLFFISGMAFGQHQLSVAIKGVPESEGKISIAVYDQADGFLKFDQVFKSNSLPANKGTTTVKIDDVPNGKYAIAVFYDKNGNDKLDTNWLGIPKEKVAFSKAKMKAFGPPKFEECSFKVDSNLKIEIWL